MNEINKLNLRYAIKLEKKIHNYYNKLKSQNTMKKTKERREENQMNKRMNVNDLS